MASDSDTILGYLRAVVAERAARSADGALVPLVLAIKAYQHARFKHTYADLLADPRHAGAAQFFLDELYGPHDFSARDAQFIRIVPALVRVFPPEIVQTVRLLAEVHALSESLDTQMARALDTPQVDAVSYGRAWRVVDSPMLREQQISLMVDVGRALDRHTRSALLRHTLKLMRGPASAAGLGDLQRFLESGFDTFRRLRGAEVFLRTIAGRERSLAAALFAGTDPDDDG